MERVLKADIRPSEDLNLRELMNADDRIKRPLPEPRHEKRRIADGG
jgi:hypothetical protein